MQGGDLFEALDAALEAEPDAALAGLTKCTGCKRCRASRSV